MKIRLDQLLVDRGLAESKTRAQALIASGNVLVGTRRVDKSGHNVAADAEITIKGQEHPWVSRGGMKLSHAIAEFALDVRGATAIDVGASTGGFTDVLLHHGAAKIYAVDVGHGQLAWRLRNDPRVVVMEKTNARTLTREQIPDPVDLVVCDASFISLKTVLPAALQLVERLESRVESRVLTSPSSRTASIQKGDDRKPQKEGELLPRLSTLDSNHSQLIALIKPQFEVGKDQIGKGGVVRDAALHQAVCEDITQWLESIGWQVHGLTESPITGPAGNKEFLLLAKKKEITKSGSHEVTSKSHS